MWTETFDAFSLWNPSFQISQAQSRGGPPSFLRVNRYLRQACSKVEIRVCVIRVMLYGLREVLHSFLEKKNRRISDTIYLVFLCQMSYLLKITFINKKFACFLCFFCVFFVCTSLFSKRVPRLLWALTWFGANLKIGKTKKTRLLLFNLPFPPPNLHMSPKFRSVWALFAEATQRHTVSQLSRSVKCAYRCQNLPQAQYTMRALNSKWKYEKLAVVVRVTQTKQKLVLHVVVLQRTKDLQRFAYITQAHSQYFAH